MSIAEFSAALKNKAIQSWFTKEAAGGGSASATSQEAYRLDNINVLVNPVNIYRTAEQTSEKTAFIITKDTIRALIIQYQGAQDTVVMHALVNKYFDEFKKKNQGARVSRRKITVGANIPAVYFPNISFDTITNLVNSIMGLSSEDLAKYYEKGHVIGLASELLEITRSRIAEVPTSGATGKSFLLQQLDNIISYYTRLDLDSANIQPAANVKVYASVNKTISRTGKTRYLVELQPKQANQESAREVQATIGTVRKLFSSGALSEKALSVLITKLQKTVSDPTFQADLVKMKSSPTYLDMIGTLIAGTLSGSAKDQVYNHSNVLIGEQKIVKPDLKHVRAEAKKQIAEAEKVKKKLQAKPQLRTTQGRFTSLASLQTMLNLALAEQIQRNMGTGTRKDVLNYRTGRFAESAQVTRMSESRAGMITAFYTYMKYPYQTFEPGYAQGSPKTRDPKLLISKSIREILSTQVKNRLRAVLA